MTSMTAPVMSEVDRLTGRVVLHLDAPAPRLSNERPELVNALTRGKPASALPTLVSALFSLCGHAHQITSALAVRAAQGEAAALSGRDAAALQLETLREHLRRLWLDWPRVLRGEASIPVDRLQSLHGCPALQGPLSRLAVEPEAVLAPTRDWLETHVFGEPLTVWLLHWLRGGEAALADWCHRTDTLPARLLRDVRAAAQAVRHPLRALVVTDGEALRGLVQRLASQPGHARVPVWDGVPVETGPWCRTHETDRLPESPTLWWRMGARLADLARLALPDEPALPVSPGLSAFAAGPAGRYVLQSGAVSLGDHAGVAWVEMARGTLLHWVALEGEGPRATVRACQVVAPTEWNFHPQGPVASLLLHDPALCDRTRLALLPTVSAAYDPCVPFAVMSPDGSVCPAADFPATAPLVQTVQPGPLQGPEESPCTN